MILNELTTHIAANSTLVVSTDLFMHSFPATAKDTAVCLYETGGVGSVESFGGIVHERPSTQVLVRSTSYLVARNIAQTAYNTITAIKSTSLSGTEYLYTSSQQSPFDIGDDESGRVQISCNYFIYKEPSST